MDAVVLEAVQLTRVVDAADGPKPLVRDINFRLSRGLMMGIVGPSGAGKSTLLRLLNRLDEPTGGQVLLQGENIRAIDPRELRRRVGMVMQRPYLFPGTVATNVAYGPAQMGAPLSGSQIADRLRQVGISGYADRDVSNLSGGEAQRVSIARALANEPEVLLLDEPTSALDPEAKLAVEALLALLVRERHATCVWVTHDREQARRVADLVLKVDAGESVALGATQDVLDA